MMKKNMPRLVVALMAAFLLALLAGACDKKAPRKAAGEMDNPAHHTRVGHKRIAEGMKAVCAVVATEKDDVDTLRHAAETSSDKARTKFQMALDAFNKALQLDDEWGPAYSGMAIADAYLASLKADKDARQKKSADAEAALEKAGDLKGKSREWKIDYHLAFLRVLTILKWDNWLDESKEHYEKGKDLLKEGEKNCALEFFMGEALAAAYDFGAAESHYNNAYVKGCEYEDLARKKKERINLIRMANPQTDAAKRIAMKDYITRADVAALFIEELQVKKYLDRAAKRPKPPKWKAPRIDYPALQKRIEDTRDIKGHPLEQDIREFLALGVTGLEETAAHKFYPDRPLARAEFAMMVAQILSRGSLNSELETQFIGQDSDMPDVMAQVPYFNAVKVVTTRGLMKPWDIGSNTFGPKKAIPGARALETVNLLRQTLEKF